MIQEEVKRKPIPYNVVNADNLTNNYAPGPCLRVRCIAPEGLYYNFLRRRENDEFILHPMWVIETHPKTGKPIKEGKEFKRKIKTAEDQFSEERMEIIEEEADPNEQEIISTAQQAVNKLSEEADEMKRGPGRPRKNA